ncbi:hypothetical protein [uncultured Sulfitobacter sp.]|uniref:hypothetical protein n=1 Tax=uncultured Sulfitobacter sp. TaxID=191468 RepID=UPI00263A39A3|nr:hypothetical protein [uncultured Sulfitobacter sp.]
MRFVPIVALLSAAALAACTPAEITTPPISVTPKNAANAVGLDVYAGPRRRGNPVPSFRGQETLPIRSAGVASDGQRKEISGVPCTLDAGVYSAKFTTPANLIVPDYGPNSPAIFIRCAYEDQSGSVTVNAFNATTQQRMSNAAAGGIIGVIIVGAVTAAKVDNEKDEFKYPAVTVQMRKQKN